MAVRSIGFGLCVLKPVQVKEPLHTYKPLLALLIRNGSNLNLRNEAGDTPIFSALARPTSTPLQDLLAAASIDVTVVHG